MVIHKNKGRKQEIVANKARSRKKTKNTQPVVGMRHAVDTKLGYQFPGDDPRSNVRARCGSSSGL